MVTFEPGRQTAIGSSSGQVTPSTSQRPSANQVMSGCWEGGVARPGTAVSAELRRSRMPANPGLAGVRVSAGIPEKLNARCCPSGVNAPAAGSRRPGIR